MPKNITIPFVIAIIGNKIHVGIKNIYNLIFKYLKKIFQIGRYINIALVNPISLSKYGIIVWVRNDNNTAGTKIKTKRNAPPIIGGSAKDFIHSMSVFTLGNTCGIFKYKKKLSSLQLNHCNFRPNT